MSEAAKLEVQAFADACAAGAWKRYMMVIWTDTATPTSVDKLNDIADSVLQRHGAPIAAVHYVVPGVGLPDAFGRKALSQSLLRFRESITCVAVIIEGSGFWASALRSFVTGISMVAHMKVDLRACSTPAEGVTWCVERQSGSADEAETFLNLFVELQQRCGRRR